MRNAVWVVIAVMVTACAPGTVPVSPPVKPVTAVDAGKAVAFDRRKGHCLACHVIVGGELPGTVGPALVGMKARFPDKSKLRAQIYDARVNNPNTIMPPFGPNRILTDDDVDKLVEFVLSL